MATVVDLNAEAAKLTMFHGQTPRTTRAERRGSTAQLGRYRNGLLLLGKSAGTGHWETHPEDELVHVLDGTATLDILLGAGPRSFSLGAGMIVVVPQGAWHRFRSQDGRTTMSAVVPGDHIDADVDDPRPNIIEVGNAARPPCIIDVNTELTNVTAHHDPAGGMKPLATYRDGILGLAKFDGVGRWGTRRACDELLHILAGTATLESLGDGGGSESHLLRKGMIVINPQGARYRLSSVDGVVLVAVTSSPGKVVDSAAAPEH